MRRLITLAMMGVALSAAPLAAQTAVKNPAKVTFTCPDHDKDTGHEIDIVRVSDGAVIQTLNAGDPPAASNGDVTVQLNVQPINFGRYRLVARATAGNEKSENSAPSPDFDRALMTPTAVRF